MFITGLFCLVMLSVASSLRPCAYWCEGSFSKKIASFYCCSYEPSLTGPSYLLAPPCHNLCTNRTGNDPAYLRNCKTEISEMRTLGTFKECTNFNDCNLKLHDLCCTDNCLPRHKKMCVKL